MNTYGQHSTQTATNHLRLRDLLPDMAVCGAIDPGNDESSDPDDYGREPEQPRQAPEKPADKASEPS